MGRIRYAGVPTFLYDRGEYYRTSETGGVDMVPFVWTATRLGVAEVQRHCVKVRAHYKVRVSAVSDKYG